MCVYICWRAQEPSATPRLLRLIQRWIREQARGGAAAGGGGASTLRHPRQGEAEDWTALSAESKDFLGKVLQKKTQFCVSAGEG